MSGDGEMGVLISQSPAISRSPFVPTLACLCTNWSYTHGIPGRWRTEPLSWPAPRSDQHAIVVVARADIVKDAFGIAGETTGGPGPPGKVKEVRLFSRPGRVVATLDARGKVEHSDAFATALAHELLHAVNIDHHGNRDRFEVEWTPRADSPGVLEEGAPVSVLNEDGTPVSLRRSRAAPVRRRSEAQRTPGRNPDQAAKGRFSVEVTAHPARSAAAPRAHQSAAPGVAPIEPPHRS